MTNETNRAPSSAPTAGRQSIDHDEKFHLLGGAWISHREYYQDDENEHVKAAWNAFIAHIDTWAARSAGDALARAAKLCDAADKSMHPADLAAAIRKLGAAPAPGNIEKPAGT